MRWVGERPSFILSLFLYHDWVVLVKRNSVNCFFFCSDFKTRLSIFHIKGEYNNQMMFKPKKKKEWSIKVGPKSIYTASLTASAAASSKLSNATILRPDSLIILFFPQLWFEKEINDRYVRCPRTFEVVSFQNRKKKDLLLGFLLFCTL